jgi:hypothetical protein
MGKKKISYERPVVFKEKKMTFPMEIIQANGKRVVCKQCSSCHACR